MTSLHSTGALLWLAAVLSLAVTLEQIPDYIKVCHKSDPKLPDCMINSLESLRPYLAAGIPEMDVPSLEPLYLGDLLVSENSASNGLRISAKDIKAFGPSDYSISNFKVVKYGEAYTLDVGLPSLYVTGVYNINGQILLLPLRGSGKFTGNFTNSVGKTKITITKVPKNGEDYFHMQKIEIKITVGKGMLKLHNLFNGDKVLGDTINDVINQNFAVVSEDVIPLIEKALQRTFKKTANKITSRYTYDQLLPL